MSRNYRVVVGPTNKEKLEETGICIGWSYGNFELIGKYRHLHDVIKKLNLTCLTEVTLVPTTRFPERL